ncbi:SMC2 (predicted), partial [Pycnogonum litorale]
MEATLKETQMAETKMNAAVKHQKDAVNEEKKKKKELEKNSQEDLATINNKEKESRKYRDVLDNFQKKCQKDADDLEAAQTRYQAICAGLSTNTDGQEATLADQLMAAKNEIASSETETKRAEMRLKHAEVELKKKENECKKTEQGYEKDKASHDKAEVNVKRIGDRLGSLEYEDGCEEKLSGDRRDVSKKLSRLSENMERIEAKYPDLKFEYKDPEKNFDRRKVYGPVCNLFRVKDNRHTTALEVCAGGKLHNIVVDSEETCKKLLKNGQLKRRYTFIPLSKISGSVIGNQVANKAERLVGKENVSPALSLVEYDPELCPAMEYVFGSWFVCKDMNSAMEVTFNESIMTPSVTIDGDKVDPSGTLSGGSRSNIRSVLSGVNEFNSKRTEYDATKRQLDSVDNKIKSMRHVADKYRSLKNEYELKNHELELLKTRLHAGAHHQQLEEVLSLNKMIEEQKETFRRCGDVKKKAEAKVRDLESKLKDSKSYREKELKAAEDEIAACKKNAEQSNQKYKEKQQEVESNNLELEELRGAIVGYRQQAEQVDVVVEKQVQELLELTEKADRAKDEVEHLQGELKAHKDLLKAHNKDIAEQQARRDSLIKKINHNNLQIQRCEHEINKYHRDAKDAYAKVEHLLSTYDWIVEDKKYFGQANTAYDFVGFKASDAGRHLQKL